MLNTLLESNGVSPRRRASSLVSLTLHLAAVGGLVLATADAGTAAPPEPSESIAYVEPPPPEVVHVAPSVASARARASAAPTLALPVRTLVAPDLVPLAIPEIDLTRAVTSSADFATRGPVGNSAIAACCSTGSGSGDGVWSAPMVEKVAAVRPGSPVPNYPEMLRSAGVTGEVRARFVVDTAGRVNLSRLTIVHSDHELFSRAVEASLRRTTFLPAEVGGRPVAQLVEQTFTFRLNR